MAEKQKPGSNSPVPSPQATEMKSTHKPAEHALDPAEVFAAVVARNHGDLDPLAQPLVETPCHPCRRRQKKPPEFFWSTAGPHIGSKR